MTGGAAAWRRLDRSLLSRPDPALAAWVVESLWPAHGRRERWLRVGARRLPAVTGRLLRRPDAAALETGAALERILADPPAGAEAVVEPGAWVLALPHPDDRRGRLTAFLFPAGGHPGRVAPDRVVKLRRRGGDGPGLATEGEVLSRLARELPEGLARTVPPVQGSGRVPAGAERKGHAGWEVLVLGAVPGRSAYVELQGTLAPSRGVPAHLDLAVRWLVRFQEATARPGASWSHPPWDELAPLAAEGGGGAGERPGWHRRLEDRLGASPLSRTAAHGDFWARNLLVEGAGREVLPGVVDWESFRAEASPFEDLFTFAATYALSFPWGGRRRPAPEALERGFLRENRVSRALRDAFDRYGRAMGLPPGTLEGAFRVFLLGRACPEGGELSAGDGRHRGAWLGLYRRLEGGEPSVFSG